MVNSVVFSKSDNADIRRVVYIPKYDAEVEYLESTGTQWIDSGVAVLNTTGIEIVAQKIVANNADSFACGIKKDSRYFNVDVNHYNNNTNGILYVGFGDSQYKQVSRVHLSQFKVAVNVNNSRKIVFNDTTASWNLPNDISVDGNIYVFASNGSSDRWRGRIFYLKIYDNTTLVRDFIPVRVGSVGYMYDKVSGQLFGNSGTGNFVLGQDVAKPIVKRCVMPIRVVKEVHVSFARFPFISNVDEVVYTQDINRRSKSTQTPKNITYTGQSFQVWAWTENNAREKLTCFIGCEYFYPQYGSKLFVHSSVSSQTTNGIFRGMTVTNLDFCKCWDATYITSLATAFKDTSITDFSGIQDWNLINLTSMWEMASQLAGGRDFRPFLKMGIGDKVTYISAMFYGNAKKDTTDWSPMCSNYHWKLVSASGSTTYLPYCNYLDMTNWDLTEWNMEVVTTLFSHGAGALKIKTPILPLTVMPMKLPYTYYDVETEQAYTEIPLNLDRQLTLYKNKSDFGK